MTILDRLLLKEFSSSILLALVAFSTLFIIINAMENLDDFLDHSTRWEVIIRYYIVFLPEILRLLTPVALLLASLFTTGRMAARNEITAIKAAGISLIRFLFPLLILAFGISVGHFYFSNWIVPIANQQKNEIEALYLKKHSRPSEVHNFFFRESATTNVYFQYYRTQSRSGELMTIERFRSVKSPRLIERIEADRFWWDSTCHCWILQNGTITHYDTRGWKLHRKSFDTLAAPLQITPAKLRLLQAAENELTLPELYQYITTLQRGGKDVRKQFIDYHSRIAFSFSNVVVVLFGVPFAFLPVRRRGIALEIGVAIFAAFFYLAFTKISQSIVAATTLPPVIGGWITNALFLSIGIANIIRTRA